MALDLKQIAEDLGSAALQFAEHYQPKCDCPEHESCEECDRYHFILQCMSRSQREIMDHIDPVPPARVFVYEPNRCPECKKDMGDGHSDPGANVMYDGQGNSHCPHCKATLPDEGD